MIEGLRAEVLFGIFFQARCRDCPHAALFSKPRQVIVLGRARTGALAELSLLEREYLNL